MRGTAAKNLRALARFLPGAPRKFVMSTISKKVNTPAGEKVVARRGPTSLAKGEARAKYNAMKREYVNNSKFGRSFINAMGEQVRSLR